MDIWTLLLRYILTLLLGGHSDTTLICFGTDLNSSSGSYLCSSVSTWWCHSSRSAKNSSRSDSLKTISFPPSPARWRSTLAIIMSYGSMTLNWTTGETVLSKTITWGSKRWISLSKSGNSWVEGDEDVCLVNCQTNVKKCLLYCFDIL